MMYDVLEKLLRAERALSETATALDNYGIDSWAEKVKRIASSVRRMFRTVQKQGERDALEDRNTR